MTTAPVGRSWIRPPQIPPNWTDEMALYLQKNYSRLGLKEFRKRFNRRFQKTYTERHLSRLASLIGVAENESNPDFYSVAELASMVGISHESILKKIEYGHLEARRHGRRWMVPKAAAEAFLDSYALTPPWPAVKVTEAARQLGYSNPTQNHITKAAKRGFIESVRIKGVTYIKQEDLDAAKRFLRRTGYTQVMWYTIDTWRHLK